MTLLPRNVALVLMLSLAASGATQRAAAQSADYPNRPVSFIVPFAPGGVTSLFARILGQKLEQRLGKPFVVAGSQRRRRSPMPRPTATPS
jgi:tripartite-type tricarboxylate transporter receptor subunit TctC